MKSEYSQDQRLRQVLRENHVHNLDYYSGAALWKPSVEDFMRDMQLIARTEWPLTTSAGCGEIDPPIRYIKRRALAENATLPPDRLR